jgi:hypothetical protein
LAVMQKKYNDADGLVMLAKKWKNFAFAMGIK